MISEHVKDRKLKVRVKPNSNKTEIEGYDAARDAVVIKLKAPADKNKANQELVKFLSKELGRPVEIKSGHKSRDKVLII
ncbi:DUF167 domain-containing protein [Nanoarchaeota archaeon]